jgi:hypothetical protein
MCASCYAVMFVSVKYIHAYWKEYGWLMLIWGYLIFCSEFVL